MEQIFSFFYYRVYTNCYITIIIIIVSGVRLSPLHTVATTGLLYQSQMMDDGDCGEIGGMKIGRGNRSTQRKPAPAPLCPPQIPHDQTRARTRAAAVGNQRLTAWASAQPTLLLHYIAFPGSRVFIFIFYLVGWDLTPIRSLCGSPRFV
jgi:hypothetical protein